MPTPPRGAPPPPRVHAVFWNSPTPARLVALGDLFGDERHFLGKQTVRCRKARGQCAGCRVGLPEGWYGYVPAAKLLADTAGYVPRGDVVRVTTADGRVLKAELVAWYIPPGNAGDVSFQADDELSLRGLVFDCRPAAAGSPKRLAIKPVPLSGPLADIPNAWDMDVFLDRRERAAGPAALSITPAADELPHEAIARYRAALAEIEAKQPPSLLDALTLSPPITPPPAAPTAEAPEVLHALLRAAALEPHARGDAKGGR